MKKLMITYRATIDRHVPIAVRSRMEKVRRAEKSKLFIIRERIRVSL